MPIYEFNCQKCGEKFEELIFGSDTPRCPHCGSDKTTKIMSCCAKHRRQGESAGTSLADSGRCSGCSGGNCSSCCH